MSLYTPMPLELVFDGWSRGPGPFVDLTIRGVTMRVVPVSPGVGRIERLIDAPLDCYLKPEFQPGQTVFYTGEAGGAAEAGPGGFGGSPAMPLPQ